MSRIIKHSPTMLLILFLILQCSCCTSESNMGTYIVLLQKPDGMDFTESTLGTWYQSFLSDSSQSRVIHSYRHVASGFAAKLTSEEALAMKQKEGVVAVRPTRMVPFHTTRSPIFLGLDSGLWNVSNYGNGVIIGLVDTGIAADHPSFSGHGMPPPPSKWKGRCDNPKLCNNKLIGARNFDTTSNSTSKNPNHGTHTASIAAGRPVEGASYYGQANGTATGMAPLAHLALYAVSGASIQGVDSDMLAAIDAAIEDGVDVISISMGLGLLPFYDDMIAIGAFAAIRKGIFVSCSAGNEGPDVRTLSNEAPWILTVGASTIDRAITATVVLGNGAEFKGESLFQPNGFPSTPIPLVYAGENGISSSAYCEPGSLRNTDVKGKIVLCERGYDDGIDKGREVKENGGVAMILMNDDRLQNFIEPQFHTLPTSQVGFTTGVAIKEYLYSTTSPAATILFNRTTTAMLEAPLVAEFSSRGPNNASPGILKPDILGPGVSILAAWPTSEDHSPHRFFMASGTSMSCPHLAGVAALLRSVHPDWSPAAIKSAIMTTASLVNPRGQPIADQEFRLATVFDMGSGHVNPSAASDPGLIYDIEPEDYVPYLCGLGYSDQQVEVIVQRRLPCFNKTYVPEAQLNYPSFSIKLGSDPQTYTRTVTNVGKANSSYTLETIAPSGVDVKVKPDKLAFSGVNQKATYTVTFSMNGGSIGPAQGFINWVADGYYVRTPIAVIIGP